MRSFVATGAPDTVIDRQQQHQLLVQTLSQLSPVKRVLIVPPDFTRYHSGAGEITEDLFHLLHGQAHVDILPALGTHSPMTDEQMDTMFGAVSRDRFKVHDWREGLVRLGDVPGEFVRKVSGGKVDYPIHVEIDHLLVDGDYDLILSVGQVVPHEVIGMANQNKNIFVGAGGQDTINKTHFLGAVVGMESLMGRGRSPVRDVLNYAEEHYLQDLPVVYVLTVRDRDQTGQMITRGLYISEGDTGFQAACRLSQQVNLELLDEPVQKAVVYLDPGEFKSTWLGNKAIYRTRMALANGGELIVLAPGVKEFGEDAEIDRVIRKVGYVGTPSVRGAVEREEDVRANLSAAAHLIHGSSEGRFQITYAPGHLTRTEIEKANFNYADLSDMMTRYHPATLSDGVNQLPDGETIFFISNPATGLWALRKQFEEA